MTFSVFVACSGPGRAPGEGARYASNSRAYPGGWATGRRSGTIRAMKRSHPRAAAGPMTRLRLGVLMSVLIGALGALVACSDSSAGPGPTADAAPRPDAGSPTYAARGRAGEVSLIQITRADPGRDLCAGLLLETSSQPNYIDIDLPEGWVVKAAYAYLGAATCHQDAVIPDTASTTSAAAGAVTWPGDGALPSFLSVDATLSFTGHPWIPRSVALTRADLPVSY